MATLEQRLALKKKAVHAACRQLGMDEDTRRAMMQQIAGVRSTKDLDLKKADLVLDHLKKAGARLGKKAVGRHPGKPHNFDSRPYLWKIEALLADMKLPWAYADAIAENITGGKKPEAIQTLAWVKEEKHFVGIIAALHQEQKKRLGLACLDGYLKKLGKTRQDVEQLLAEKRPGYKGNWTRDLRMLDGLCRYYGALAAQA